MSEKIQIICSVKDCGWPTPVVPTWDICLKIMDQHIAANHTIREGEVNGDGSQALPLVSNELIDSIIDKGDMIFNYEETRGNTFSENDTAKNASVGEPMTPSQTALEGTNLSVDEPMTPTSNNRLEGLSIETL